MWTNSGMPVLCLQSRSSKWENFKKWWPWKRFIMWTGITNLKEIYEHVVGRDDYADKKEKSMRLAGMKLDGDEWDVIGDKRLNPQTFRGKLKKARYNFASFRPDRRIPWQRKDLFDPWRVSSGWSGRWILINGKKSEVKICENTRPEAGPEWTPVRWRKSL